MTVFYTYTIDVDEPLSSAKQKKLRACIEETLDKFFGSTPFGIGEEGGSQIDPRKGLTTTVDRSSLIQDR